MRWVVAGSVLVAGAVGIATGSTSISDQAQQALTMVDTIPTEAQLNTAFNDNPNVSALPSLAAIAGDSTNDVGIRLRAIHALKNYCTAPCATNDVAHQSVLGIVNANTVETVGSPILLLRAAIETLGPMKTSSDVPVLVVLLDHQSRDIRAATARALRDLCNTQAITPLRVRYAKEQTEQVKLAISEALRILDQCP